MTKRIKVLALLLGFIGGNFIWQAVGETLPNYSIATERSMFQAFALAAVLLIL